MDSISAYNENPLIVNLNNKNEKNGVHTHNTAKEGAIRANITNMQLNEIYSLLVYIYGDYRDSTLQIKAEKSQLVSYLTIDEFSYRRFLILKGFIVADTIPPITIRLLLNPNMRDITKMIMYSGELASKKFYKRTGLQQLPDFSTIDERTELYTKYPRRRDIKKPVRSRG